MAKIKAEIKVLNDEYCGTIDAVCPMCFGGEWDTFRCALFGNELEIDDNNHRIIRCDKCKQAEVKDDNK